MFSNVTAPQSTRFAEISASRGQPQSSGLSLSASWSRISFSLKTWKRDMIETSQLEQTTSNLLTWTLYLSCTCASIPSSSCQGFQSSSYTHSWHAAVTKVLISWRMVNTGSTSSVWITLSMRVMCQMTSGGWVGSFKTLIDRGPYMLSGDRCDLIEELNGQVSEAHTEERLKLVSVISCRTHSLASMIWILNAQFVLTTLSPEIRSPIYLALRLICSTQNALTSILIKAQMT